MFIVCKIRNYQKINDKQLLVCLLLAFGKKIEKLDTITS